MTVCTDWGHLVGGAAAAHRDTPADLREDNPPRVRTKNSAAAANELEPP